MWIAGNHFPGTRGRPEASPPRRYFTICSSSCWWHQLDYWSRWIWWLLCFEKRLGSWTWRNSCGVCRCAGGLGSKFLFNAYRAVLEGSTIPDCFIIRSPEALRPLTLCNCDCKLLTSATCRGLHWDTMRRIHPSLRCISSRQMTDNIFEIETTALAHVACVPQESGIFLADFAAAYPSVNHPWIFSVLENTGLPDFLCRFLRSIYKDSITHGICGSRKRTNPYG